jgi:hypothetical protein
MATAALAVPFAVSAAPAAASSDLGNDGCWYPAWGTVTGAAIDTLDSCHSCKIDQLYAMEHDLNHNYSCVFTFGDNEGFINEVYQLVRTIPGQSPCVCEGYPTGHLSTAVRSHQEEA